MSNVHHKEWFIAALVVHIRQFLMQQKITTQDDSLEMAMQLEASPIGQNLVGMNHIQAQLANLTLQMKDIKKEKEEHDDL